MDIQIYLTGSNAHERTQLARKLQELLVTHFVTGSFTAECVSYPSFEVEEGTKEFELNE